MGRGLNMLRAFIGFGAMAVVYSSPSLAVTPALLIGHDLKPRAVNVQALGGGKISYFDDQRTLRIASISDVLQIRFQREDDPSATNGGVDDDKTRRARIDLIDGQRLFAKWTGAADGGETLIFRHEHLGEAKVKLDAVSRFAMDASITPPAATPQQDQAVLANGDVLGGFVLGVTPDEVAVQTAGGQKINLPAERVRAVWLSNPRRAADDKQHVVWLRDGGRLLSPRVDITADALVFEPAVTGGRAVRVPMKQVERIELASSGGRLVDLVELPRQVTAGGDVFGLPMPPRAIGVNLHAHAPLTVTLDLPPGASRFAAVAALESSADVKWADCFLIIRAETTGGGDTELARHQLNARTPAVSINAALPQGATQLHIQLDPGVNGPVMDRVVLRDAMVLVESQ